jgi:hypothetical protein
MSGLVYALETFTPSEGRDLVITIECPPVRVTTESPWAEWEPGPHTYLAIHGLNERVQPYLDAILSLIEAEPEYVK